MNEYSLAKVQVVSNKYPRFNLSRIENYLEKLERYNSIGLEKYPFLKINDVEIYKIKDKVSSYAMKHNEDITIVDTIFKSEVFEANLGKNAASFAQFCNMVITADNTESKVVVSDKK